MNVRTATPKRAWSTLWEPSSLLRSLGRAVRSQAGDWRPWEDWKSSSSRQLQLKINHTLHIPQSTNPALSLVGWRNRSPWKAKNEQFSCWMEKIDRQHIQLYLCVSIYFEKFNDIIWKYKYYLKIVNVPNKHKCPTLVFIQSEYHHNLVAIKYLELTNIAA